jgi:hypothetical protein
MDKIAEILKKNPKQLEKTSIKVEKVLSALENKTTLSQKEQSIYNILKYLEARIKFIQLDNAHKLVKAEDIALNKILESAKKPDISDSDKKKLEKAIITIQKNLLEKSQQNINSIMSQFDSYLNYQQTGDFEMNMNIDQESIGNMKANLKISDYTNQNSNFDSRFK